MVISELEADTYVTLTLEQYLKSRNVRFNWNRHGNSMDGIDMRVKPDLE